MERLFEWVQKERGKYNPVEFAAQLHKRFVFIHPFPEGNTRAIAIFAIQYLSELRFEINNEPFEKNARYFRDALVRASYNNMELGVSPDYSYLNKFFENVLYNKSHTLNSEELIL